MSNNYHGNLPNPHGTIKAVADASAVPRKLPAPDTHAVAAMKAQWAADDARDTRPPIKLHSLNDPVGDLMGGR